MLFDLVGTGNYFKNFKNENIPGVKGLKIPTYLTPENSKSK